MECNLLPSYICRATWENLEKGFLLDKERNEVYTNDSQMLVRFKCFGVCIANPLRMISFIVMAMAKLIFQLMIVSFQKTKEASPLRMENIKNLFFSPGLTLFYGLLIQGGAFMGLMDPFRGRKIIALTEMKWSFLDHFLGDLATMAPCFQPRANTSFVKGNPWLQQF